jgi:hypothetical protein
MTRFAPFRSGGSEHGRGRQADRGEGLSGARDAPGSTRGEGACGWFRTSGRPVARPDACVPRPLGKAG